VYALRFNTGARSNVPPLQTLAQLLELADGKPIWIDLKGRQMRIIKDALRRPEIALNHQLRCTHISPSDTIIFRNGVREGFSTRIVAVSGNKVYVDPIPPEAVGAGQSVNIHAEGISAIGYFTTEDKEYIDAARELGIHNYMLSFVERKSDITNLLARDPEANIVLKIESPKGIELIDRLDFKNNPDLHLMAARDDLLINLPNRIDIIGTTHHMLDLDPGTIVASRIMTSLLTNYHPSLGDIADMTLLKKQGCYRIMLCDDICSSDVFEEAMDYLIGWWGR